MSQPQYTWKTLSEAEAKAILADEDAEELPFRFINEQGRIEIAKILIDHHKYYSQRYRDPADEFLIRNHLQKWIEEAEFQLREATGPALKSRAGTH